ncbi:hypothetical protein [Bradyrhizobium sp. CCGUVB23]|uniref:hypothetical protein n=1 Tax=Bradyrhizobium sp. CCGUVB23 TaxID=2949630 RepID=UPI0020B21F1A|nr:hypothetical protein [Bradyrhizobium sp. CCGUVB23]MCP3462908.1 hypothetical protein [Bradyrhizobium sp. CCGUVB23]
MTTLAATTQNPLVRALHRPGLFAEDLAATLRPKFSRTFIAASGFTGKAAAAVVRAGDVRSISALS